MSTPALLTLPAEAQLLFHAARETPDDAAVRELLAGPLDWTRLALLAHREQALTVLWQHLRRFGDLVPAAQAAQLAQLAQVAEFHLAHLQHRFEQTVAALDGAGLEVVLLKGAGLAYTAYPSFAARPMSDVDLLLRPEQVRAAQALLGTLGWDWERGAECEDLYATHQHLPPLFDTRGGGANLELHTGLFSIGDPLGLTAELVRSEAREVRVGRSRALVPHPEHQLLHCCLHFAWSHGMHSGAWRTFRDVAAITRTAVIDWERFVALAHSTRGASCCYWTFDLARALTGVTTIPEEALRQLRSPVPRLGQERLRRHLAIMLVGLGAGSPSVRLDRLIWEAAIAPAASGHGAARPWEGEERWLTGDAPPVGAARPRRLRAGLHRLAAYTRYLRTMLAR